MKRYRFRLAQVQRVRQVQEDLAAAQLGAAQRAEVAAVAAEQARWDAVAARPRPRGAYGAPALLAARAVWDAELGALRATAADRATAAARTAECRDEWLGAARRVKALALLDERRRAEHQVEADREEAARVDDLVAGRYRLDHPEGGHEGAGT